MGIGQFGGQIEAARFMCAEGARVFATDLKEPAKLGKALELFRELPIQLRLGEHREEDFLEADLVVVSPAVPKSSRFLQLAIERGKPWTTELTLTIQRLRAPVYAVTGSNGKSTVTTLLGRAVEAGSGARVHVGGNIGRPLLNEVDAIAPDDRCVLELSSFQLEDLRDAFACGALGERFAPDLALVTNVTPNHLDRHGTLESYAAAKRTLVEHQREGQVAVLNRDDPIVAAFAKATRARVVTFGLGAGFAGAGAFLDERGAIAFRDEAGEVREVARASAMRLPGRHNLANALAVAAAAGALGLDLARAGVAIESFAGLRDRLEPVAERRGVRYVNDSKSTTPEAAKAGIESFPSGITLVAGGADKKMDFAPLAEAAASRCATVVLIGDTRARLEEEIRLAARGLASRPPAIARSDSLDEAVALAAGRTPAGQVVLFSPACASYDMFTSFEERGERFREAVRRLPE
jgi:UDP-N-acetylmuramoylalanine--D-glutamate ligase